MINVDMIGYLEPGDDIDLDIVDNEASVWLFDRAITVAATYVPGFPVVDGSIPYGAGSDHSSFWDNGYEAIALFEDTEQYSPWIHTPADTVGLSYNCPPLAENSTKVALALLADLAGPSPIGTGVAERIIPASVTLEQNVPNPFNPRTRIRFTVTPPGGTASLTIFDVAGREVIGLLDEWILEGTRTVYWNGRNKNGEAVPSGVYFYRLTFGQTQLTRKMVLVR
jgi:hypothetical protein